MTPWPAPTSVKKIVAGIKDEQQKRLFDVMVPAMKNMTGTLDVRKDGTYTMKVELSLLGQKQTNTEEGTWKMVKSQGKELVIETLEKGKTKKETHNITRITDDHFSEGAPKEMGPLASALRLEYRRKKN